MRKIALVLLLLCLVVPVGAQRKKRVGNRRSDIREEAAGKDSIIAAPAECTQTVRDLIRYLGREKPDIASDKQAQERWLSPDLKRGLQHRQDVYKDFAKNEPDSPEGPPSNADFLNTWDNPTSYSIAAARRVGERAIIDVVFKWGPGTQYPGDSRLMSFVIVQEAGAWKLDDIYTYRGKFVEPGSLTVTFQRENYP